jgi:hypothetical protein
MSKKIQLQIAEPCHENWDAMTPVEQGKFCGSCQKQVMDFTEMSDRQIAEFFKKPSTGSVCGRFMNDQLERDIEIPKKRIPWVKYFFTIALPAFFISKASAQKMGKPSFTTARDTITKPATTEYITLGMVGPDRILPQEDKKVPVQEIKGLSVWVVDAVTGLPVEGAEIVMSSTLGKEKLYAGNDGLAILNIYRKLTFHGIEISSPGYTTKKITYGEFKKGTDGRIIFKLDKVLPVKEDILIKGEVKPVPVCNVRMGATIYVADIKPVIISPDNNIYGVVVNEKNEPVPFASVAGSKRGQGVMANEKGEFMISKDWLKKGNSLQVSSVGFEPAIIKAGEEAYRDASLYVQLKANNMLEEAVVVTSYGNIKKGLVVGSVSKIKGQTLTINKTETNNPMEDAQLKVYPNPAAAGGVIHLSFKSPEEGYYHLQIISASGQLVKQQEIWLDAEAALLNIELPSVSAGTYFLVLANKRNGKKYSEKIMVQ